MRQNNRKKSQFPASVDILNDAYLDYVANGTNYRIKFSDFLTELGVTGTINQAGAGTSTPVLDKQAQDNFIRNIEDGPGIKSSVSIDNGITLEHNLTQNTDGAEILIDPTSASPTIASIIGGAGINAVETGGHITISTVDETGSTKTVVVYSKADFPEPTLNVIQLDNDREYLIANDVDLGVDKIMMGLNCSIRGVDNIIITLSYTGTDYMINCADSTNKVSLISLAAPNGGVIQSTDTIQGVLIFDSVRIDSALKAGHLTGVDSLIRFTNSSFKPGTVSNGFEFFGTFNTFLHQSSSCGITAGILYDLGVAVFKSIIINYVVSDVAVGATFLSGAIDNGNIDANGIAKVDTSLLFGGGTGLSGVSIADSRWFFSGNNKISDTRTSGLLSLSNNALETVITAAGTPSIVNGDWIVEGNLQTSGATSGRITFDTSRLTHAHVIISVSVELVGGGDVKVSALVAINGVPVENSRKSGSAKAGSPASITIPWQKGMNNGDYFEVFVANEDSTSDLVVINAMLDVT